VREKRQVFLRAGMLMGRQRPWRHNDNQYLLRTSWFEKLSERQHFFVHNLNCNCTNHVSCVFVFRMIANQLVSGVGENLDASPKCWSICKFCIVIEKSSFNRLLEHWWKLSALFVIMIQSTMRSI
jgi:hypothetical protein